MHDLSWTKEKKTCMHGFVERIERTNDRHDSHVFRAAPPLHGLGADNFELVIILVYVPQTVARPYI